MDKSVQNRIKIILKKTLKVVLRIVGSILILFLLLVILLQIPAFQNFAKNKAISYLEGKIHTKVALNKIEIGLPKKIILEGIYLQDQKKDTLLYGEKISVDISLFELFNNKVEINAIHLSGITAKINRSKDAVFNFDYIIKSFSSPVKKVDHSTPMSFSLNKIKLDKVKFSFNDVSTKNDVSVYVNYFETQFKKCNIDKMDFEIPQVDLDGFKIKFTQGLTQVSEEAKVVTIEKANDKDLKLKVDEINLANIDVDYLNENSKLSSKIDAKKMILNINNIDLKNQKIDIESLEIDNTKGNIAFGKIQKIISKTNNSNASSNNWSVKSNKTDISKIDFKFDDNNANHLKKGIDYRHLDLKDFNFQADKISYNPKTISGKITAFSVKDTSGFSVQALKTDFFYGEKGASLRNLYLKTPQTEIKNQVIVGYSSINTLTKNIGQIKLNANLSNSKIGFKDILLLAPNLSNTKPFVNNANGVVQINGKILGRLNALFIPNLEISGIGSTKINANGKIIGLPDIKTAYFDLKIKKIESSANDINQFTPKGTIPQTITIPNKFATAGIFKGTMDHFTTNLDLVSTFGNAKINATIDLRKKNKEKYNAKASFDNFDLGRLIKNNSIGKISLETTVKGIGLNPKTANAAVNALILKADYNKYSYKNLKLSGNIANGKFNAKAVAKDPNLTFDMISSGSFQGKYPMGKINLNIDIADLNKLNLHAGPMKIRGELNADIQSADLDYLNGKISATNFVIANEKEQFVLDSINITAITTKNKNILLVKSQFLNANIDGKYKLSQIVKSVNNSFSKYYDTNKFRKFGVEKQQFAFKINIKEDKILYKLIPELKSSSDISFEGRYNSVNDSIVLKGSIPNLVYGDNSISGASINIDTKDNSLLYNVVIDNIQNANFQLPYTGISGKIENNTIDYTLQLRDLKDKDRYFIAGTLKSIGGNSEINIIPKNLLLNYEAWNLSEENLIRFGKNGVYVSNFELSKASNSIKMQSQSNQLNAPLAIDFKDFEIETITNIAQKSNLQIGGKINGNVLLKNLQKTPTFTSDLMIEQFTFQKDTVGNLKIQVDNAISNTYNAKVELTGFDNKLNLDGNYKALSKSFDMNLNVQKLNIKSIQGFSFGNITESTGFLNGNLKLSGTSSNPKIIGELKFNEVGFKVKKLNAQFKSMNDKIIFSDNTIALNNFGIKDEKDNDLNINGKINTANLSNPKFDLKVDADNFKAINSKAKDNDLFYGELFLDNHLTVKGTLNNPIVDGTIKINKDTKFTIVLPQSDPSIADREGIVEFIDQDQPKLFKTVSIDNQLSQSEIKGILASVNIEVDKDAELSIIIDKANGDFLKLKGEAQLAGGIDASGKTSLTGRYEVVEGSYEMNFNLIKRKFDIKKGGYILWTGEPTTADVSITAIYKSKTAPIDLVNDQLGSISPDQRNTYKQKIPFETELKLNGELLKPVITFNIVLPDGNNDVSTAVINTTQAKLAQLRQQPDELNKQVFALLLLNRFVGENPFSSESGGTTASGFARESASKILSQQINNFAGDLISGVELNFDLQSSEEYTTGQKQNKTELNVGVSKKLLNDRLKVTVGSSFGIEGEKQVNQKANNIAGDVALDYQLSKDGRYKVRAYRVNKYQVALQGQVIETGVAFILTIDYNKFRELFHKSKPQRAIIQKKKSNE